jgi:non-ribosomal peptide synthetase component F
MLEHWRMMLDGIAANPDQHLSELPMLTAAERHQLLVEWNQTRRCHRPDRCLHQLFQEQVERTPGAVAVVFEKSSLTYRELNNRANRLAHHLRSLGVGPDALVAICVERSLETIIGLIGILKAGGAYVPIDPHLPRSRLALIMADAAPAVLLTQRSLSPLIGAFAGARGWMNGNQARTRTRRSQTFLQPMPRMSFTRRVQPAAQRGW